MCTALECMLCKYIPAAKRQRRAPCAVREHMPFDGLCHKAQPQTEEAMGSVHI